jgi:hypothetical protein
MRILYVAMTRAREKLILLASYTDAEKELRKHLPDDPGAIAPEVLLHTKSAPTGSLWRHSAAGKRRPPLRAEGAVAENGGEPWLVRLVPGPKSSGRRKHVIFRKRSRYPLQRKTLTPSP